jgi:hypothetical protein
MDDCIQVIIVYQSNQTPLPIPPFSPLIMTRYFTTGSVMDVHKCRVTHVSLSFVIVFFNQGLTTDMISLPTH